MQFIPAIDVLDGQVVRLLRGNFDDVTVYAEDPTAVSRSYVEQGAGLIHVVDLGSARDGTDHARTALCRSLAAAGVPFQVGGGIRTPNEAASVVASGATRVVVGTVAVLDDGSLSAIVAEVAPARVVVAVDVRDGRARGSGWEDQGAALEVVLDRVSALEIPWVLVTGITQDGTMEGPDVDLLHTVRNGWPDLSIIASGGVGSLEDLRSLASAGFDAVVVGRALFEGRFSVEEGIAAST